MSSPRTGILSLIRFDLGHVGLPHVLDLPVHLVKFFGGMSQGGHSELLLLLALFCQSTPSCLKVIGWVVGGGPKDFIVSPSPNWPFIMGIALVLGMDLD